jgi:hypothetical protein
VILFGREPLAGRVKTRLAAEIGAERAAQAYRLMLEHALREAAVSGMAVTMALADPPTPVWLPPSGVAVEVQQGATLGERMAASFARAFAAGASAAVLIGSDVPAITAALLREATAACADVPAVFGPSADGGYYLVAQRAPGTDLFAGVPWSSPRTLAATLARAERLGVPFRLLATLGDVDTAADLRQASHDPQVDPALRRRLAAVLADADR